jgi:hypothetical protein
MNFFDRVIENMINEKVSKAKRMRVIVFVSLITLLSMISSTVAWFTVNTLAGVDSLDMHISVSAQLKVSMENHGTDLTQYEKVITNEMIDSYLRAKSNTTLADLLLDPVTTTDGVTFTNQRGTIREANNRSYLEFECYFIATRNMTVHLTNEEADINGDPTGRIGGTAVSTTSPAPQSDVVRACRVDFEGEGNAVNTWEPNKEGQSTSLPTFDLPAGATTYSDDNNLFTLEKLTPKKVTVRVWLEGEDPECDNDIQRADLKIKLSFVGIREGSNTPR